MIDIDTQGASVPSSARCEVAGCHQDGWRRITVYRGRTPDYVVVCKACARNPDVCAAMQPPARAPIPDLELLAAPDALPRPRPGRASSPLLSMVEGGARASTTPQGGTMSTNPPRPLLALVRKAKAIPGMCLIEGCSEPRKARGFCSRCLERVRAAGRLDELGDPARPLRVGQFATPPSLTTDPIPEPAAAAEPDGCRPEAEERPNVMLAADPWAAALEQIGTMVGADGHFDPEGVVVGVRTKLDRLAEVEEELVVLQRIVDTSVVVVKAAQTERDQAQTQLAEFVREEVEGLAVDVLGDDFDLQPNDRFGVTPAGRATTVSLRPWMRPARDAGDLSPEELSRVLGSRLIALNAAVQVDEMAQAFELRFQLRDERGEAHTSTLSRGEPMWPWSLVSDVIYASVAAACGALVEDLHRVGYGEVEVASDDASDDDHAEVVDG